jgi:hypothetical protein
MNVGMLWFDNDSKIDLNGKIERAAVYYRTKYGRIPTLCFVHPSMLPTTQTDEQESKAGDEKSSQPVKIRSGGIEVRPNRSVLPNHIWIGVNGVSNGASSGS